MLGMWMLGASVVVTVVTMWVIYRSTRSHARHPLHKLPPPTADVNIKIKEEPAQIKTALSSTKSQFLSKLKLLFTLDSDLDWEGLEEALYTSDLGPQTVQYLMQNMHTRLSSSDKKDFDLVKQTLKSEMFQILSLKTESNLWESLQNSKKPVVWMVVGVNGAGKTTSIGKLASHAKNLGLKVMIAAGDTFRAAAGDQLKVWSERAEVEIFAPEHTKDPAAVAFEACQKALAQNIDLLIVDTAGRLHTQKNLMEELKKMKRVMDKAYPSAPQETLLILDGNSGQNALIQAREFHQALDVTGVVLTKMDGTAKGGVAVGLANELKIPIKLIGIGEKVSDLKVFSAQEFVDSIL